MHTLYQEELAEIPEESVAYARAMRRNALYVRDLRRIIITATGDDLRQSIDQLEANLAGHLTGNRWYLVRRKRRNTHLCRPSARYRAKLSWGDSLTLLRLHKVLARKVSVYEYDSLADAVRDVALVSRRSGYSGILGSCLPDNAAARLTCECYLRPRTIPAVLAGGQATFFAMLTADRRGIDLYWHSQAEPITAAARSIVAALQPA